jgi:hypothetical protein
LPDKFPVKSYPSKIRRARNTIWLETGRRKEYD